MSAPHPAASGPDHERYDEVAVGWALHALEPEDEAGFAAHLAGCDRCTGTVAETAEVMAAMATDLDPAEPSADLRDRIRAEVARTHQVSAGAHRDEPAPVDDVPGPVVADLATRRRRRAAGSAAWRSAAPRALVAAGVAAVLAVGGWAVVATQDRDAAQATAAGQEAVMDALLAPGRVTVAPMAHDGHTVATVVVRDGQAQVVTDGMTVNDRSTSTYVLWGMTDEAPVALGTFDVVAAGVDLRTVGSDGTGLDDYSAYGISIEPGRSAPSAPTEIVANGQVDS